MEATHSITQPFAFTRPDRTLSYIKTPQTITETINMSLYTQKHPKSPHKPPHAPANHLLVSNTFLHCQYTTHGTARPRKPAVRFTVPLTLLDIIHGFNAPLIDLTRPYACPHPLTGVTHAHTHVHIHSQVSHTPSTHSSPPPNTPPLPQTHLFAQSLSLYYANTRSLNVFCTRATRPHMPTRANHASPQLS